MKPDAMISQASIYASEIRAHQRFGRFERIAPRVQRMLDLMERSNGSTKLAIQALLSELDIAVSEFEDLVGQAKTCAKEIQYHQDLGQFERVATRVEQILAILDKSNGSTRQSIEEIIHGLNIIAVREDR